MEEEVPSMIVWGCRVVVVTAVTGGPTGHLQNHHGLGSEERFFYVGSLV